MNRWDDVWVKATIQAIVERHVEDLYTIQLDVDSAMDHLQSKMPGLQAWAEIFVRATPRVSLTRLSKHTFLVDQSIRPMRQSAIAMEAPCR